MPCGAQARHNLKERHEHRRRRLGLAEAPRRRHSCAADRTRVVRFEPLAHAVLAEHVGARQRERVGHRVLADGTVGGARLGDLRGGRRPAKGRRARQERLELLAKVQPARDEAQHLDGEVGAREAAGDHLGGGLLREEAHPHGRRERGPPEREREVDEADDVPLAAVQRRRVAHAPQRARARRGGHSGVDRQAAEAQHHVVGADDPQRLPQRQRRVVRVRQHRRRGPQRHLEPQVPPQLLVAEEEVD
mmetsp:Transcript_8815/g.31158  ORF Transcript_8815/g.31158 Transcript_8815/m.31158 type:complete len:247 (-) Transcript_8815:316-1056(-)